MVALPLEKKKYNSILKVLFHVILYALIVTLTEAAEKQAEKMVIERVSIHLNSLNGKFSINYSFFYFKLQNSPFTISNYLGPR